ncbi:MAG: DUF945 family protein [Legionellales bacterium]|nr:DUF945 family protein [Legionellales bacterium]
MRKQLLSVILLFFMVLVVVVCLPYVMGYMAEKRIKQLIVELSETPDVTISIDEYQRHWFSATVQLTAQAGLAEFNLPKVQWKITQRIKHGPVMWVDGRLLFGLAYSESSVTPTTTAQQVLQQIAQFLTNNELPELSLSTLIRFNRSLVMYTDLDEFSLVSPQQEATVSWQGVTSKYYISSDGSQTDMTALLKPLTISTPLFDFSFKDIQLKVSEMDRWPKNYHFRGFVQLEQSALVDKEDKSAWEIRDLVLDLTLDAQDELFNGDLKLTLGGMDSEELKVDQGILKFSVKNLDVPTLDEIATLVSTLNLNQLNAEQARLLGFALLPKLPQLLTANTQVRLDDLSLVLPEGALAMSGYLQLTDQADLSHWSTFWQEVDAKVSVAIPSTFLRAWLFERVAEVLVNEQQMQQVIARQLTADAQDSQSMAQMPLTELIDLDDQQLVALATQRTDQQIAQWVTDGYLQHRGSDYRLDLLVSDGLIRLNGQIVSINQWFN